MRRQCLVALLAAVAVVTREVETCVITIMTQYSFETCLCEAPPLKNGMCFSWVEFHAHQISVIKNLILIKLFVQTTKVNKN